MREIDDAHQAEDDVQPQRHEDIKHPERQAIDELIADLVQHEARIPVRAVKTLPRSSDRIARLHTT